jgi:hypothetical protein
MAWSTFWCRRRGSGTISASHEPTSAPSGRKASSKRGCTAPAGCAAPWGPRSRFTISGPSGTRRGAMWIGSARARHGRPPSSSATASSGSSGCYPRRASEGAVLRTVGAPAARRNAGRAHLLVRLADHALHVVQRIDQHALRVDRRTGWPRRVVRGPQTPGMHGCDRPGGARWPNRRPPNQRRMLTLA